MKFTLTVVMLLLVSGLTKAQDVYDNGLFNTEQQLPLFNSTQDLTEYLQQQMPGTFRYYERLDMPARKKVLDQLLANEDQDLTEIVIQVYRQRGRN
jgi:hypothetical protein